jgi:hypothetical protein
VAEFVRFWPPQIREVHVAEEPTLTSRQLTAVAAILGSATIEEAAASAKVAPRTLRRWSTLPPFRAELARQRSRLIGDVLTELARASVEAARVLRDIAVGPAPAAPRVAAAKAILDMTGRFEEATTLEQRLSALEAAIGTGQPASGGGGRWQ